MIDRSQHTDFKARLSLSSPVEKWLQPANKCYHAQNHTDRCTYSTIGLNIAFFAYIGERRHKNSINYC